MHCSALVSVCEDVLTLTDWGETAPSRASQFLESEGMARACLKHVNHCVQRPVSPHTPGGKTPLPQAPSARYQAPRDHPVVQSPPKLFKLTNTSALFWEVLQSSRGGALLEGSAFEVPGPWAPPLSLLPGHHKVKPLVCHMLLLP
jgi:hypothetical protein